MGDSEMVTVQVIVRARWTAGSIVEMTRDQFDAFCKKIDAGPRGYEEEKLAEEIMGIAQINTRDGDLDSFEVDDFFLEEGPTK